MPTLYQVVFILGIIILHYAIRVQFFDTIQLTVKEFKTILIREH